MLGELLREVCTTLLNCPVLKVIFLFYIALLKLCEEVPVAIETGDCTEKNEIRNIVKMWTYIVYQLVEAFEVEESKPDMLTTISGKVTQTFLITPTST